MATEKPSRDAMNDATTLEACRELLERVLGETERLRQEVAGWREDLAALRHDITEAYDAGERFDDC